MNCNSKGALIYNIACLNEASEFFASVMTFSLWNRVHCTRNEKWGSSIETVPYWGKKIMKSRLEIFPGCGRWKWRYKVFFCKGSSRNYVGTLGGIASICFRFHFQQTLRIQIQGSQGCQKIRKIVRNPKLPIARLTIHPSLSKIKNNLPFFKEFWCIS